ncbi:MAG: AAA family ATPase [Candidatus Omnitrophica bacterium]|nr:AAA family ATPase [Candidatus Omnitrophota bacterium]
MNKDGKKVFIAATRQNDGKTAICIGLLLSLISTKKNVGFIKPVGQKYVVVDGEKVDKDTILMKKVCGLKESLRDMNPVAIEEGFTSEYLDDPHPDILKEKIINSYNKVSAEKDVIVIEGTGHAGVGSVFDLNNADVAQMLDAPVVLVSIGGIGRPIDEVALNVALFEKKGVKIKGVVINKVDEEKKTKLEKYLTKGFTRMGLKVLGLLPFISLLSQPSLFQVCEAVKGKVLAGEKYLFRKVGKVIVGAMTPRHAIDYLQPNTLLVTPGDREDLILSALIQCTLTDACSQTIVGIVLTGGLYPHKSILDLIKKVNIPTISAPAGTYEVASAINLLVGKIREEDSDKIKIAHKLVQEHICLEEIF